MTTKLRTREGDVTAVDTKTQLTTLGSQTAPGALTVPGDMTHVVGAYVTVIPDFAVAADAAFMIRLEGPGIPGQIINFAAGGAGSQVATGGVGSLVPMYIPLGVPVSANQEIQVFAEMVGEDVGTLNACVTLRFADSLGDIPEALGMFTVEGDVNAIDTLVRLTTQGSVTAPSRLTPPGATKLQRLVIGTGTDGAASGAGSIIVRIGGSAVQGGEQVIVVGAHGAQNVQAGSDAAPSLLPAIVIDGLDIDVDPTETVDISAEMVGVDVGDVTIAVTAMFV